MKLQLLGLIIVVLLATLSVNRSLAKPTIDVEVKKTEETKAEDKKQAEHDRKGKDNKEEKVLDFAHLPNGTKTEKSDVGKSQVSSTSTSYGPRDCLEVESLASGFHQIYPLPSYPFLSARAYCQLETDGGGWTVIMRRMPIRHGTRISFQRTWREYELGFSDKREDGEFWLGLKLMHFLTFRPGTKWYLKVKLWDFDNNYRYAHYNQFMVYSASYNYLLYVTGYSGTAGDSLSYHSGSQFSTIDADHDTWSYNCASRFGGGGWWFKHCHFSTLTGDYYPGTHNSYGVGLVWYYWRGYYYSYKRAEMMIRPATS